MLAPDADTETLSCAHEEYAEEQVCPVLSKSCNRAGNFSDATTVHRQASGPVALEFLKHGGYRTGANRVAASDGAAVSPTPTSLQRLHGVPLVCHRSITPLPLRPQTAAMSSGSGSQGGAPDNAGLDELWSKGLKAAAPDPSPPPPLACRSKFPEGPASSFSHPHTHSSPPFSSSSSSSSFSASVRSAALPQTPSLSSALSHSHSLPPSHSHSLLPSHSHPHSHSACLPQQPWSTLFPAAHIGVSPRLLAPVVPTSARYTAGEPDASHLHQQRQETQVSSCSVEDEGKDQEVDCGHVDCSDPAGLLPMEPVSGDAACAANSFSWNELERSCRLLDEANIRIESIDLSHMGEGPRLPRRRQVVPACNTSLLTYGSSGELGQNERAVMHFQTAGLASPAVDKNLCLNPDKAVASVSNLGQQELEAATSPTSQEPRTLRTSSLSRSTRWQVNPRQGQPKDITSQQNALYPFGQQGSGAANTPIPTNLNTLPRQSKSLSIITSIKEKCGLKSVVDGKRRQHSNWLQQD